MPTMYEDDRTNSDRASSGVIAIMAYANDAYMPHNRNRTLANDEDLAQVARDAIADILHRLERARVHPGVALLQAYERYYEEALADDPGDRPSVAYPHGCPECDAAPGKPCRWGCDTWTVFDHTRLTAPEQLDEPAP